MVSVIIKVFISFRGSDSRHGFLTHLCTELNRHNSIQVLVDDRFKRGNFIDSEIEKSIEKSTASIAIISEDFASSDACLDELVMMLKRLETEGDAYMVLPVYYHVSKEEVQKQTGSFATSLVEMKAIYGEERVKEWSKALTKVTDLGGRDVRPNEPENSVCHLIVEDVLRHAEWLNSESIPATLSEKSFGVKSSVVRSKKLWESLSCVELSIEEEKKKPEKRFNEALVLPHSSYKKLGNKEIMESTTLKGNRNQVECIEKLVSEHSNNYKSDDSRFRGGGNIRIYSQKQRHSNESILQALLKVKAFFSQDLELDCHNLGDLSESFQILKGLTEKDGINTVEKIRLSILEKESASVISQIRSSGEGMKEVDLAIQKYNQQSYEFTELSKENERVEKVLGELYSHRERLKAELIDAERRYKKEDERRCCLINTLKTQKDELENLNNANLVKQKVQVEELEQDACKRWEEIREVIDGLISKFSTRDKSRK